MNLLSISNCPLCINGCEINLGLTCALPLHLSNITIHDRPIFRARVHNEGSVDQIGWALPS
jgi:hypothetical protein